MKNLQKKEKNLNQLIEKLNNLNVSYSQFGFDNKSLEKENNLIKVLLNSPQCNLKLERWHD